jgi:hypothetical protein
MRALPAFTRFQWWFIYWALPGFVSGILMELKFVEVAVE